jgi:hypothetical protein
MSTFNNNFESTSTVAYSHFFPVNFDLFLINRDTRDGSAVGGSLWASVSVCTQFQTAP